MYLYAQTAVFMHLASKEELWEGKWLLSFEKLLQEILTYSGFGKAQSVPLLGESWDLRTLLSSVIHFYKLWIGPNPLPK